MDSPDTVEKPVSDLTEQSEIIKIIEEMKKQGYRFIGTRFDMIVLAFEKAPPGTPEPEASNEESLEIDLNDETDQQLGQIADDVVRSLEPPQGAPSKRLSELTEDELDERTGEIADAVVRSLEPPASVGHTIIEEVEQNLPAEPVIIEPKPEHDDYTITEPPPYAGHNKFTSPEEPEK